MYDSVSGQFISSDSYLGASDNPSSQLSYMWNNNNPLSMQDPSGYDPFEDSDFSASDGSPTFTRLPPTDQGPCDDLTPSCGQVTYKYRIPRPVTPDDVVGLGSVYTQLERGYIGRSQQYGKRASYWRRQGINDSRELPGTREFSRYEDRCLEGFLICKFGLGKYGGRLANKIQGLNLRTSAGRAGVEVGRALFEKIGSPDINFGPKPEPLSETVFNPTVIDPEVNIEIP